MIGMLSGSCSFFRILFIVILFKIMNFVLEPFISVCNFPFFWIAECRSSNWEGWKKHQSPSFRCEYTIFFLFAPIYIFYFIVDWP